MLTFQSEFYPCLFFFFLQDKGFEDAKAVVQALKSKGVSAIGAAGFCWGGKLHFFTSALCSYHSFFPYPDKCMCQINCLTGCKINLYFDLLILQYIPQAHKCLLVSSQPRW